MEFPNLTAINDNSEMTMRECFRGCTNLKYVNMPKLSSISSDGFDYIFYGCTNLMYVNFSEATAVLSGYSVPSAFGNTNNTYKVIVPDSLYDSWIAASGWSTIASHIVKASEYLVIMTQYTGYDNMDNN